VGLRDWEAEVRALLPYARTIVQEDYLHAIADHNGPRGAARAMAIDNAAMSHVLQRVRGYRAEALAESDGRTRHEIPDTLPPPVFLQPLRKRLADAAKGHAPHVQVLNQDPPPLPEPRTTAQRIAEAKAEAQRKAKVQEDRALLEELSGLRDQQALFRELTGAPLPPVMRTELSSGLREATAYALFSDLHVEELVRPTDTPTGNAFTLGIADLRMRRFFEAVVWGIKSHTAFKIRKLVLWYGGDMATNHLHPENVETAQLGPVGVYTWAQERLDAGIAFILEALPELEIDVVCNDGNHGRTTRYMNATTAHEHSWERTMYNALAFRYRERSETRVRIYAPDSSHAYHQVYRYRLHFHHGHDVRFQGGVGGLTIPLNKAIAQWDLAVHSDYHFIGHWHQLLELGRATVNGSLIGYNGYAMSIKATPEVAQQAFGLLDSKRGKCWTTPVWVTDPGPEKELWRGYEAAELANKGATDAASVLEAWRA
jgi:hypothetical protein